MKGSDKDEARLRETAQEALEMFENPFPWEFPTWAKGDLKIFLGPLLYTDIKKMGEERQAAEGSAVENLARRWGNQLNRGDLDKEGRWWTLRESLRFGAPLYGADFPAKHRYLKHFLPGSIGAWKLKHLCVGRLSMLQISGLPPDQPSDFFRFLALQLYPDNTHGDVLLPALIPQYAWRACLYGSMGTARLWDMWEWGVYSMPSDEEGMSFFTVKVAPIEKDLLG